MEKISRIDFFKQFDSFISLVEKAKLNADEAKKTFAKLKDTVWGSDEWSSLLDRLLVQMDSIKSEAFAGYDNFISLAEKAKYKVDEAKKTFTELKTTEKGSDKIHFLLDSMEVHHDSIKAEINNDPRSRKV